MARSFVMSFTPAAVVVAAAVWHAGAAAARSYGGPVDTVIKPYKDQPRLFGPHHLDWLDEDARKLADQLRRGAAGAKP